MIGAWGEHAQTFLLVFAAATTLVFALPIFFTPIAWARVMRFEIPHDTDLAVYFGRCLGAFILLVEAMALHSGLTGAYLALTFDMLLGVFGLMFVVHVYGWLRGIQPITENLEIGLWVLFSALALAFYP